MSHFYTGRDGRDGRDGPAGLPGSPGTPGLGTNVVQSLNSPFFPPHTGAEPGRAKRESRITCMRMLRTPPFFSPKSGEKPYLEVFSRFDLWRDFLNANIQATISGFRLKLIPNQWNFTSATLNHIRFAF